jgi:hypothetical protein
MSDLPALHMGACLCSCFTSLRRLKCFQSCCREDSGLLTSVLDDPLASGAYFPDRGVRLSPVQEYMEQKRQRITVRSLQPVNWVGESKYALEQIAKLQGHPIAT